MKVSVIISTHNREKYIGRAVRSLLLQNWAKDNFEIIAVNDGSTDHTAEILKEFGDKIRVINLPENKGLANACNEGILKARGFFVVRVDDDDYVHEDFLKTLYNFLAMNKEISAVSCDYFLVDDKENILSRENAETRPIACGIMFRRDNLIDIGLYDKDFLCREEEDLRMRFTKKYKISRIPLPLYRYTLHGKSLTANRQKMDSFGEFLIKKHSLNKEIKIGEKAISAKNKAFVIAEVGVNYYEIAQKESISLLDTAKKMIESASRAGADAVKFQIYKAGKLASVYSPAYWDTSKEPTKSQFELFKKYDKLDDQDYEKLAEFCKQKNIIFMATPFDEEAVELVNKLSPVFKIASADITHFPLLKAIAKKQKPIILSAGASTIEEIREALDIIKQEGNSQAVIMHCVLNYPTDYGKANLKRIEVLKKEFPENIIGYSDHTLPDPSMAVLGSAFTLGAYVLEKHFTLDKSLPGNDHYHAMDENDLKKARESLDLISEIIKPSPDDLIFESQAIKYARRSLVARRNLKKGEKISAEDIAVKRPGSGISPKFFEKAVGKTAKRFIGQDEILNWEDLE